MKNIILIAPPAAGKGTQAKLLNKKYNLPHISTGDLIRASLKNESEISKKIKEQMENGKLIDDEILIELLKERLDKEDCKNGYILDGFPRSINQAKIYDEMLKKANAEIGYVILLDVPKEITKARIVSRVSCPKCGSVYNTAFQNTKPLRDGLCDSCGETLITRDDDNEKSFEKRYQTYLDETKPIIKYYEDKGVLWKVTSVISPEDTFEQIEKIIKGDKND